MFHGACQLFYICFYILYAFFLIKNVPFQRIKLNSISYDITKTYEGLIVKNLINLKIL